MHNTRKEPTTPRTKNNSGVHPLGVYTNTTKFSKKRCIRYSFFNCCVAYQKYVATFFFFLYRMGGEGCFSTKKTTTGHNFPPPLCSGFRHKSVFYLFFSPFKKNIVCFLTGGANTRGTSCNRLCSIFFSFKPNTRGIRGLVFRPPPPQ